MLLPPESVLVLTRGGTGRRDGMLKCSINVFEFAKTGNDARDELLTKFCLLISVEGESWKQGDDIGVDVPDADPAPRTGPVAAGSPSRNWSLGSSFGKLLGSGLSSAWTVFQTRRA